MRHGQQTTRKVDQVHIIPRFRAAQAKIGLKWMTNILQLAIKGNELTNQTKRYLVGDTWQLTLFNTKNWWACGLLSVPKKLRTPFKSNWNLECWFRGEEKPEIPENNLSQQRLRNHHQNLNEDSITQVILIWGEASCVQRCAIPAYISAQYDGILKFRKTNREQHIVR